MDRAKKTKWRTGLGGVQSLSVPTISASIEYKKEGYFITLYTETTIPLDEPFQDIEDAKKYAVTQMKSLVSQSLKELNSFFIDPSWGGEGKEFN